MTLAEALKSGEKIRRKWSNQWLDPKDQLHLYDLDILADDWEVYREPRTFEIYVCPETGRVSIEPDKYYRFEKIKVVEVIK